jgi:hypothetical protein
LFLSLISNKKAICLPEKGLSNELLLRIFEDFYKKNAKNITETSKTSIIMMLALETLFSCK